MRGLDCVDTGRPVWCLSVKRTLGRVFNVLGNPVDRRGDVSADDYCRFTPQCAPPLDQLSTQHGSVRHGH